MRCLAVSFPVASALWTLPEKLSHGKAAEMVKTRELVSTAPNETAAVKYVTVPLDHFDPENNRSFALKYFLNDAAFKAGGPMIFNMPQEGPTGGCGTGTVVESLGAVSVCPQHRFFGDSVPFNDSSVANLKYLSVEQNLEDMAAIVKAVRGQYPSVTKVVAVGGSYSGASSAWFRNHYPSVVDAAISYSPPVTAKIDFTEYDTSTLVALSSPDVRCAQTVARVMAAMDRQLETDKASVYKAFNATYQLTSPFGDVDFMYGIGDSAAGLVQYGNKEVLCKAMEPYYERSDVGDVELVELFAKFTRENWGPTYFQQCTYNSTCMRGETSGPVADSGRSWGYITCTELGYFQTAPAKGLTARPRALTAERFLKQCEYIFPGAPIISDQSVEDFNKKFGGPGLSGETRVFELDFSDDQWKMVSSTQVVQRTEWTLTEDEPFMLLTCDGCAHCGAGAPSAKIEAIDQQILSVLGGWDVKAPAQAIVV
mmetsp:Transcript_14496/g.31427  ORF Transcript_14496/g.31427 Transcript_14496/m.31427 type:complete len:482 (+) Transcript_14496:52-1497(+)